MVRGGDGALAAQVATDAPVLGEGAAVALDGRRVCAGGLVDVVGGVVAVDGSDRGQARARVVVSVVLDDVVLDERVGGPSVDGQVAVPIGREGAGESDGPVYLFVSPRVSFSKFL